MKFFTQSQKRRRGSVLPLVALSITVLLGAAALAVDYSVLLADKNQLQRGCDSAALAGAAYLKRSGDDVANMNEARNQALLVAQLNNLTSTEVTADRITFLDNNTKIRVAAERPRSLFFARILGIARGNISASAVAVVTPGAGPPVPIAITPTSKARYENDRLPHNFTLMVPQERAFQPNYSGLTPFDPFQVFDLSSSQGKSATQMQRQLAGDLVKPVSPQVGGQLTGLSLSLSSLTGNFKDGISPRFQRAAGTPWFDPQTGALPEAWRTVGTRLPEVLAGASPLNPRIVKFVVVAETTRAESNYQFTIVDFATAYVTSVQEGTSGLSFTATFLPPGTGNAASSVALIE